MSKQENSCPDRGTPESGQTHSVTVDDEGKAISCDSDLMRALILVREVASRMDPQTILDCENDEVGRTPLHIVEEKTG